MGNNNQNQGQQQPGRSAQQQGDQQQGGQQQGGQQNQQGNWNSDNEDAPAGSTGSEEEE